VETNLETNLGLFNNGSEANLVSTVAMVEDVLVELGHYLNECRADYEHALHSWCVVKGSASIRISLVPGGEYAKLRVVSPVITTDARVDVLKLYRTLLSLNCEELSGCAFGTRQNEVLLIAERSTLDLDRSEVFDLLRRIQEYADYYDDRLVDEFGGRLGGVE
jgi:hypothetical protein